MLGGWIGRMFGGGAAGPGFAEVKAASETGSAHLVDVREPGEFAGGHIPGAINLPLSRFDVTALPNDKPVILLCLSGARSARALGMCKSTGRNDIANYSGGMSGWRSSGGAIARR